MGNTKVSKTCYLKDGYKRSLLLEFHLFFFHWRTYQSFMFTKSFSFFPEISYWGCWLLFLCIFKLFKWYSCLLEMVASYICSVRVCRHSDKQMCSLRRFGRLLSFLLCLNSPLSIPSACWDWWLCFQKCLIIKQNKDILVMRIIEILIESFLKSDVNRCQPAAS